MDEVKNYLSGIEGINTWSLDDEIHGGTEVPESSKHGSMTCLNDEARKRTPMKHTDIMRLLVRQPVNKYTL